MQTLFLWPLSLCSHEMHTESTLSRLKHFQSANSYQKSFSKWQRAFLCAGPSANDDVDMHLCMSMELSYACLSLCLYLYMSLRKDFSFKLRYKHTCVCSFFYLVYMYRSMFTSRKVNVTRDTERDRR